VAPRLWEGQALRRLGRLEEAEAAYRAALTLEPEHPAALADLGALEAARGDYTQARTLLSRALELQPDLASARANLEQLDRLLGSESLSTPTP
jgi:Flp pilus assembly protein TadD